MARIRPAAGCKDRTPSPFMAAFRPKGQRPLAAGGLPYTVRRSFWTSSAGLAPKKRLNSRLNWEGLA